MTMLNELTNEITRDATKKGKLIYLDPRRCKPNPLNGDRKMKDINELSLNILEGGLQQPIVVRELEGSQDFMIITGHRRNLAILKIIDEGSSYYFNGRVCDDEIPAFVISAADEVDERLKVIQSNSFLEEAREDKIVRTKEAEKIYDLLVSEGKKPKGLKRAWISSITGYSERSVQDYMSLCDMNSETNGTINKIDDKNEQSEQTYFDKLLRKVDKFEEMISRIKIENLSNNEADVIASKISDLSDIFKQL